MRISPLAAQPGRLGRYRALGGHASGKFRRIASEPGQVQACRGCSGELGNSGSSAFEQGDRPTRIAALQMGQTHGELSEGPPQMSFCDWRGFPDTLEHLVRGEGAVLVQQPLGKVHCLVGRQDQIVWDAFNANRIVR